MIWTLGEDGKYRSKAGNIRCPHGRIRSQCKDCGGSSICEHNRHRPKCKECGGSEICEHNRQRSDCKECSSSICEHSKQRRQCSRCSPDSVYKKYQWQARNRQIAFELSPEEFKWIVSGSCIYCGEIYEPMTCDRVHNSKGYSFYNCQPLCWPCNCMKMAHSEEKFEKHIISIIQHRPGLAPELQETA